MLFSTLSKEFGSEVDLQLQVAKYLVLFLGGEKKKNTLQENKSDSF